MTKSMTAFARTQSNNDSGTLTWEVRTVNSRYLDVHMRLPEDFRACEVRYREIISKRLTRGKVECSLRFKPEVVTENGLDVNKEYAKTVIDACQQINNFSHGNSDINPIEILNWPGVIRESELDLKPLHVASETLLDEALNQLITNRESEGARLQEMVSQRCDAIKQIVDDTRKNMPEIQQRYKDKLLLKLDELKTDVDQSRLEQELVHMAQKMDVEEELDRIDSHLHEISEVLTRDEAVGRRLDFLMQELNREANTLGSKSVDISSTQSSVDLKVLIEQMREQIQNIE